MIGTDEESARRRLRDELRAELQAEQREEVPLPWRLEKTPKSTSRHHLSLEAPAVAGWYLQSPTPKKQSIVAAYEGEDCHHQRDDCDGPEPYPHHEKSMELWVEE